MMTEAKMNVLACRALLELDESGLLGLPSLHRHAQRLVAYLELPGGLTYAQVLQVAQGIVDHA